MNIYSIYKLTCKTTKKSYIGFTVNLHKRLIVHKSNANKGNKKYLYRDIRLYGWNDFECEIIYESKNKDHITKEMETYFIEYYDTIQTGYNLSFGGQTGKIGKRNVSLETIISKSEKQGKQMILFTPEQRKLKIKSLNSFCVDNNLDTAAMQRVANGKQSNHLGWKCFYYDNSFEEGYKPINFVDKRFK